MALTLSATLIRDSITTCESFVVNVILAATLLTAKKRRGHQSCGKHQERLCEILKIGGNIHGKTSIGRVVDFMVRKVIYAGWKGKKHIATQIRISYPGNIPSFV